MGKGEYLGYLNKMVDCHGVIASAVSATEPTLGYDAEHRHDNPILSFILEGFSTEMVGRSSGPRVSGDLRFYPSGELHQVTIHTFPSRNINLEFDSSFLAAYDIDEDSLAKSLSEPHLAKLAFVQSYSELAVADGLSETSIVTAILGMFGRSTETRVDHPLWFSVVREILHDRWNENLTLSEVAASAGIHPVTLCKHFSSNFPHTLGAYVRKIRVSKSLEMIKNTDLSLTDIAFACGFADQSHFSRTFRRHTGMQPKTFRKL